MNNKVNDAIKSAFEQNGGDADVRSMGLAKGMTLHPIVSDEVDAEGNLVCLKKGDANGRGFLYLETAEGVRLSTSQLTRVGNGLGLQQPKQSAALAEWFGRVLDTNKGKKCTLTVAKLFTRELSDGALTRSAVFTESYA